MDNFLKIGLGALIGYFVYEYVQKNKPLRQTGVPILPGVINELSDPLKTIPPLAICTPLKHSS